MNGGKDVGCVFISGFDEHWKLIEDLSDGASVTMNNQRR